METPPNSDRTSAPPQRKGHFVVWLGLATKLFQSGKVLKVIPKEGRVVVQGVNVAKRHTRGRPGQPGGIVEAEKALSASNVAHLDPKDNKPTRVGYKFVDGRRLRFARRAARPMS